MKKGKGTSLTLVDFGLGPYVHGTPSKRFPVYTRGNVGEVYPEVVFPFSASISTLISSDPAVEALEQTGILTKRENQENADVHMGAFGGYSYVNLSVSRIIAVRTPGVTVEEADATFLGSEGLAPPHVRQRGDRNLRASLRGMLYGLKVLSGKQLPDLEKEQQVARRWQKDLPKIADATNQQLLAVFVEAVPLMGRLFRNHLLITGGAGAGLSLLKISCEKRLNDHTLALTLLSGIGEVDSALPALALWELSRMVRESEELTGLFDQGLDGLNVRLLVESSEVLFAQRFREFLMRFGSRGPNEWEVACEVWGTNPQMPLAIIDRMRHAENDRAPVLKNEKLAQNREAAVSRVHAKFGPLGRWNFDRAHRCAMSYSQARERSKTVLVEIVHDCRLALRELGRRIALEGGGQADDLWYVLLEEFEDYQNDPVSMVEKIAERRATRQALSELLPPFCFTGQMPAPNTWEKRSTKAVALLKQGDVITGIAGCIGKAQGRARVVVDPADPGDLGPGDVLIAPLTDPSWTPLFVPVEAVVVDVGGQMSHAIIVSRELGLPCVVSVTDATKRIPDGALIEVDGAAGTVTVLEV
ncbi:MAG: PEP-utilizing enzyme [Acidimicrobiales bacterium]|nr:PEP-utilizing enzyme [Acidimicrobiales bacterium]